VPSVSAVERRRVQLPRRVTRDREATNNSCRLDVDNHGGASALLIIQLPLQQPVDPAIPDLIQPSVIHSV
jgi:hypothetical protein